MSERGDHLCGHCLLPVGLRAMQRTVNGEACSFCCYGCCIAFLVKHGQSEEWDAARLLIRIGVGAFLTMNIMLISLLLYAGNLQRRRCMAGALDSPALVDLRDAGAGDSRRAVPARNLDFRRHRGA